MAPNAAARAIPLERYQSLLRINCNYFLAQKKPDLTAGLILSRNLKIHRKKRQENLKSGYRIGLTLSAILSKNMCKLHIRQNDSKACKPRGVAAIEPVRTNSNALGP